MDDNLHEHIKNLQKETIKYYLVPYVNYFHIEPLLNVVGASAEEINAIKSAEYKKRIKSTKSYLNMCDEWYVDGVLHREDGPAIDFQIKPPGFWEYVYMDNVFKQADEPEILCKIPTYNFYREWWQNGVRHNDHGPAVIRPDGYTKYCVNGKVHNSNGPAVILPDGTVEWWINGKRVDQ